MNVWQPDKGRVLCEGFNFLQIAAGTFSETEGQKCVFLCVCVCGARAAVGTGGEKPGDRFCGRKECVTRFSALTVKQICSTVWPYF